MKIDNKGWGLNTMLIMVAVILIFLLIATFFSIRMNNMLGIENNEDEKKLQQTINESYYINRINTMTEAAEKYIRFEDIELTSQHMRINMATLVSRDYMNTITDYITNNACFGYSIAYLNSNDIKIIKSYIKCDNYESEGYGDN